jgi:hypothetical protein
VARHRGPAKSTTPARELSCGCVLYGGQNLPTFACRDFTTLETVNRFTEALAAAAPAEPFFRQLAEVTRNALTRHLDGYRPELASDLSGAADRRGQSTKPRKEAA